MEACGSCRWYVGGRCKRFPGGVAVEAADWCGEFSAAPVQSAAETAVAAWVASRCVRDKGARTPAATIHAAFEADTGDEMHPIAFGKALSRLGFGGMAGHGIRFRTGIRVKPPAPRASGA